MLHKQCLNQSSSRGIQLWVAQRKVNLEDLVGVYFRGESKKSGVTGFLVGGYRERVWTSCLWDSNGAV